MESSLSKMEKDGLYLLTIGQVLHNTKNISNVSLYYNRISIVNNLRRYENNYCWIHETKSQLQRFPEDIACACACAETKTEGDSKLCQLRKNLRCPQELYVRNITSDLATRNLIVDFSSLQCISLIYKGRLYLYSNLSTCKLNQQSNGSYSEKGGRRGIICEDCKTGEPVEFSREDIERALYDIIERGEDQKYGLTLMEHTSFGTPLNGLEKVQDSVRSIGILEGSITDEPKESGIDKINVIDCDILLEDVNPAGSNSSYCPSSQAACHVSKEQDCKGCKYINDLNDYLNTPINSYNTKLHKDCKASPKCDNHNHCEKHESPDHSSGKPEANGCCEGEHSGCCEGNCQCCEKCECPGSKLCACGPGCSCQERSLSCGSCLGLSSENQNHKGKTSFKRDFGLGGKLGENYLRDCVKFANDLVDRANNELDSICSSLINQVNSLCQPPLQISIRFLEHFLCFEYLIEYNSELTSGEREALYGVSTMDKQNVILHEFIQSNVLTKQVLEETFKLILGRIRMYIIPKSAELGDEHGMSEENGDLSVMNSSVNANVNGMSSTDVKKTNQSSDLKESKNSRGFKGSVHSSRSDLSVSNSSSNSNNNVNNINAGLKRSGSLNSLSPGSSGKINVKILDGFAVREGRNGHRKSQEQLEHSGFKNGSERLGGDCMDLDDESDANMLGNFGSHSDTNLSHHSSSNSNSSSNGNGNNSNNNNNNNMPTDHSLPRKNLVQNNGFHLKEEMKGFGGKPLESGSVNVPARFGEGSGLGGLGVRVGAVRSGLGFTGSQNSDSNSETPTGKSGLHIASGMVNGYGMPVENGDNTKLVESLTPTTNTGSNGTPNSQNSRDDLNQSPASNGTLGTPSSVTKSSSGLDSEDLSVMNSSVNSVKSVNSLSSMSDMKAVDVLDPGSLPNTVTTLYNSSNLDELSNPISSDDSYKNSFHDLDQVEKQQNSSQELLQDDLGKKSDSSDVEMGDIDTYNEIYPYWWKFYVDDNTLGEGDVNARYEGIRRYTRSYVKEESSTPKNKKSGNGANYLLTRCVSSDLSTKSNINMSGLHSSRETLCPSEFNQSQPTSGQSVEVLPCFCKSCIPFISNITRMFPSHSSDLSSNLKSDFTSNLEFRNLKEIVGSRMSSILSSRLSSSPRMSNGTAESIVNRDSIDSSSPSLRQESSSFREEEIEHDFNIVNGLRRSLRAARDVATVIRKKLSREHKPLLDTLNVALLSSLRLGEYLFNNPNLYSGSASIDQMQLDNTSNLDNRFDLYSEQLNGFKGSNADSPRSPSVKDDSNRSLDREYQNGLGMKNRESKYNGFMDKEDLEKTDKDGGEEDVGAFLFLDVGVDNTIETGRSTFENDQYLSYDIVSEDDACSYSSISSNSPKIFNKRKSPTRSRRAYRSFSSLEGMTSGRRSFEGLPSKRSFEGLPSRRSFEGLPSSRRSTRELPQDDMYIYDMNNLSDKGEFEDWYADSDSSKKSTKYVQKRMPPSRPSVSNLTEIYGSQDMLIPMGPLPIGVYFDASRKLWRCQWRENGKFRTKGFSLGHYNTLADARHACILFRCQVGNMNIQPEWLTPNYIKVSDLLNRRAAQPSSTPKKSNRKKKRHEDIYDPYP